MNDCRDSIAKDVRDDRSKVSEVDVVSQRVADANLIINEKKPIESGASIASQEAYPSTLRHVTLVIALLLAQFLVALDMSIIATAIPQITKDFHSMDQVGWYGSAFFMTLAAFQTFWGKAYKFFPLKPVFLAAILVFEVGSLIIALAPSSPAVVAGRAIQGAGGAGITSGCYTICAFITRPRRRAPIMGLFGIPWICASVLGPVLGGIFTQNVSWRWCFWINLPIGGVTMLVILLLFKTPPMSRIARLDKFSDLPLEFDLLGMATLLGALICLFLALRVGGLTRPWDSRGVIGLLIGFSLFTLLFISIEWKQGERAMVVRRILRRRTIAACAIFNFLAQAGGYARVYNLPLYFQAAQGVSPSESGIRTLPSSLTVATVCLISAAALDRIGYYQLLLWIGASICTLGSGLFYTLQVDSPAPHYIIYQIVASIGMGMIIQTPIIIVQSIVEPTDMSVAIAISLFFQFVGGAVGVSSASSILNNRLVATLPADIDRATVLKAGATGLREVFTNPSQLDGVINAYMAGLHSAWIWSIVMAGASFFAAFAAEWKSVKPVDVKARAEAKVVAGIVSA